MKMVLTIMMILLNGIAFTFDPPSSHPWFQVKKINDHVYQIGDADIDNIYLITGRDSALVVDTGLGLADLPAFIRTLTDLPLIVVATHSHPDHTGACYQFPQVYAHAADFEMIKFFTSPGFRKTNPMGGAGGQIPDSVKFNVRDSLFSVNLLPVKDGHVFDLGDRNIEVISVPGHTPGSICLLDHKDRKLYTGDNSNTLVWFHTQDALPLESWLQSLKKLQKRSTEFDTLMPGHGAPVDAAFLNEQIGCVERIISGECEGKPYESFVGPGRVCAFKRAQVAYDPEKILRKK
jgi:hydroxyacylglutathione hydrolase